MDKFLDIKEIFLKDTSTEGKGENLLTSNSGFPRGRFLLSYNVCFCLQAARKKMISENVV